MNVRMIVRVISFLLLALFSIIAPDWFVIVSMIIFMIIFPSPFELILVGSFIDFSYGLGDGLKMVLTSYSTLGFILTILSILIRPRLLFRVHLKSND